MQHLDRGALDEAELQKPPLKLGGAQPMGILGDVDRCDMAAKAARASPSGVRWSAVKEAGLSDMKRSKHEEFCADQLAPMPIRVKLISLEIQ